MAAYTGQLYQLESSRPLLPGAYVEVNGPWDRFGVVLRCDPYGQGHLNLIRGVRRREGETPAARF